MTVRRDLHQANRLSWNEATRAHNSHKADQAGYLRGGGSKLFPEELGLLGELRGRRLVHLQCNSGQDTLSLARLGAIATGVDISDEAIAFATSLSHESGIPASFVRSDVYDWFEAAAGEDRYEIAFSSYGALTWLSDIAAWGRGVASVLEPGGFYATVEFHPVLWMFDVDWSRKYDFFGDRPFLSEEGVGDYVAESGPTLAPSGYLEGATGFRNPNPAYEFNWSIAEVVTALVDAGLTLELLREYPYANGWKALAGMWSDDERRAWPPPGTPSLPMMYALRARKPRAG